MGTKKEERYLSFSQFMSEIKKPGEKKRDQNTQTTSQDYGTRVGEFDYG